MLQTDSYNGLLLDLNRPTQQGHDVLEQARHACPDLPVLIMSASQSGIRTLKESQPIACSLSSSPITAAN